MRIGIAGLGSAGTYLVKRLHDAGFDVRAFDPKRPDHYIPCGYATDESRASHFMKKIGIDFEDYILTRAKNVIFTGSGMPEIHFPSRGLCTFDRNKLQRDVISDISTVNGHFSGNYDLAVDASGVSRSLLGSVRNDFLMYTKEYVSRESKHNDFYFRYFEAGKGYFWEFPLNGSYHIGAGSSDPEIISESLRGYSAIRITGRAIRLRPLFKDMVRGNIMGVGESIGTVSPVTGEGILPSIESAEILFTCIDRYSDLEELQAKYQNSIRKRFDHYRKLYALLQNFRNGRRISLSNAVAVRSVSKTMREFGIDFSVWKIMRYIL